MKTKILLLVTVLILGLSPGYSQLNNQKRKEFRTQRKLKLEAKIDQLVNSKNFVFEGKTALPSGGAAIDLTTNYNSVKFTSEKITSYMPFFGEAYSVEYGGDSGFKFEAKPEVFDIKKLKKGKGYAVDVKVTLPRENIELQLNIGSQGMATMTILSYNRKPISYFGSIREPDKTKEVK